MAPERIYLKPNAAIATNCYPSVSPSPQRFWHNGCGNGGRENSEQIDARLQRAQHYQQQLPSHCLQLCNDGELQHTLNQLQQLLTLDTPLSDPVEDKPCN